MNEIDVAVIGAGAAGIAAARRLAQAGIGCLLVEARDRLGGRAFTREVAGLPLDLGCGWLHSADENEWSDLAIAAGFAIDRTLPPWGRSGADLGFAPGEGAEFRAALEAFYARVDALDETQEDRPAADMLEPGGRWNGLIDAISTWINGVETDRVSVRDWNRYRDTMVNWRVPAGYGALIAAHGAGLGAGLATSLSTVVTGIDHAGPRLRIETTRGTLEARAAIIALPTNVLAAEAVRFTPALPDKLAAAALLPLGLADKLFLRLDGLPDLPAEQRLFGRTDSAATGSYQIRPFGRPVIEVYVGGRLARSLEAEGEAGFAAFALDQIAGHFGADVRKHLSPVAASAWGSDPFALGSYSHALPGHADARERLAAPVDRRLFFAGEATSRHDFSTAHGAYRTGIAAAEAVIAAHFRT